MVFKMRSVLAFAVLAPGSVCFGQVGDDFEDGAINPALWSVGGSNLLGFGGIGTWSHSELLASDGYLEARIVGPATANTYGQEGWIRTNFNFNDGINHIINFRWGAEVNASHVDAFNISISNGSDPTGYNNPYDTNGMWQTDNANNTRLYWTISGGFASPPNNLGQQNLSPTSWSILIDAAANTATLFQGPNLSGGALPTMPLDPSAPWHVRFYQMDLSSAGFPGTDNSLRLYDFTSIPAPGAVLCFAVSGGAVAARRRRR